MLQLLLLVIAAVQCNFVYITGHNTYGLLGNGLAANDVRAHAQVMTHPQGKVIMRVFSGGSNTFFTTHDHELYGFGRAQLGTLGDGTLINKMSPVRISHPCFNGQEIVQMAISETHVVALTANNSLCHWGSTRFGLLGISNFNQTNTTSVPIRINATDALPAKIKYICAGNFHTQMVLENDQVYNMGDTLYKGAGGSTTVQGTLIYKPASTLLQGKSIKQLACGYDYSVVLTHDGQVFVRGWNIYGSVGDNTIIGRDDFTRTLDGNAVLGNVTQIASSFYHILAINTIGRVSCWGFNGDYECGNNVTVDQKLPVAPIETLTTITATPIVQITAALAHSVILSSDNKMYSWGSGGTGALGTSNLNTSPAPVPVVQNQLLSGKTIRNIYSTRHTTVFYAPPLCNGVLATNLQAACSGNGLCLGENSCSCKATFTGATCNQCTSGYYNYPSCQPGCYGILATNSSVCNGRGNCIGADQCSCTTGASGAQCEGVTCFGISSQSLGACNGNGVCVGANVCSCNTGYTGSQCTLKLCNGITSDSISVCSGHGTCGSPETCQCQTGYTGTYCQTVICPSNCNTCSTPTTCTSCKPGYTGAGCEHKLCFGKSETNSTVCSGKGTCSSIDTCTCNSGYVGNECQDNICFTIASSSATVCSGHGSCTSPGVCQCAVGYTKQDCSNPVCFQYASSDSNVCSGHGTCTGPATCSCQNGYVSANCSQKSCFGVSEVEPLVCSGKGNCSTINVCSCLPGFTGNQCQTDPNNNPVLPRPSASKAPVPTTSSKPATSPNKPQSDATRTTLHKMLLVMLLATLLLL